MIEFFYSVGGFIVAIGVLVTIHELGHFSVARLFNVKVLRFSVGFGRPLWKRQFGKDQTELVIGLIPLGGYVRMLDERESKVIEGEQQRAFNRQSLSIRSAIVVAGPVANFLLAAILYWVALVIGISSFSPVIGHVLPDSIGEQLGFNQGEQITEIDGRPLKSWSEYHLYLLNQSLKGKPIVFELLAEAGRKHSIEVDPNIFQNADITQGVLEVGLGLLPAFPAVTPIISQVLTGSPAEQGGIQNDDLITAVDGIEIENWRSLVLAISNRPGQELEIELERRGKKHIVHVVSESVETNNQLTGRIGVKRDAVIQHDAVVQYGLYRAFLRGVENTWLLSALTVRTLVSMIRLKVSTENLGGPVTIAKVAGQSAQTGVVPFLLFLAVISVSLGVLNLLPIPVLDGGHLLYLFIEAFRGEPLSTEAMQIGQRLGIAMLAFVMFIAFYNDVMRLGS